jgi:hypothetical protein
MGEMWMHAVGTPRGKRTRGTPRGIREDNIKMELV